MRKQMTKDFSVREKSTYILGQSQDLCFSDFFFHLRE